MKYSDCNTASCSPFAAIIKATSPLNTIPALIINDKHEEKPVDFSPNATPNNFLRNAMTDKATVNPI